jgi:hypothetical protein
MRRNNLVLITIILTIISCKGILNSEKNIVMKNLDGNSVYIEKKETIKKPLNKIIAGGNFEIIVDYDESNNDKIIFTVDNNLIKYLNYKIQNGTLYLKYDMPKNTNVNFTKNKVLINISKPISNIEINDNARIDLNLNPNMSSFNISQKGNSKVNLKCTSINSINIKSEGNSKSKLSGLVNIFEIENSNNSEINGEKLIASKAILKNKNLGEITLTVLDELKSVNSKLGKITFFSNGNTIKNIDKIGNWF